MGNILIAPVADAGELVSSATFIHAHTGSSPQVDRRIAITDVVTKDANGSITVGGAVSIGNGKDASLHITDVYGGNGRLTQMSPRTPSTNAFNIMAAKNGSSAELWYSWGVDTSNQFRVNSGIGFGANGLVLGNGYARFFTETTRDTVSFLPFQVKGGIAIDTDTTSSQSAMSFFNGQGPNTRVGWIGTVGSSTSYNTSSDITLKKNIADAQDPESIILSILIRQFDWKVNDEHQRYGAIAQELLDVYPEAVSSGPDGILGVDFSKFIPMMLKHIQLLTARVALLEGAKS